jgi:hypothetical protein
MQELRIAWLNQFDPLHPWAGGAERHIAEVSRRLVQQGHSVTIIAERFPGQPEQELSHGVTICRPGGRVGVHLWALANYRSIGKFDIVLHDLSKVLPWNFGRADSTPVIAIVRHLNGRILMKETPWPTGPAFWIAETVCSDLRSRSNHH